MVHPIVQHIPSLRRYARALKGSRADADDLVQDTLERAYAKWSLWRRGSSVRPWLFAIMHNVFLNQAVRAGARLKLAPLDDAGRIATQARQEAASEAHDVAEALEELPDAQREALLLVALEGFSYEEAARILGVPVGTLTSRLAAARVRLRELTGDAPVEERQVTP
jgi:RNA polymerase sigma-70 factor (ECF subfamily)